MSYRRTSANPRDEVRGELADNYHRILHLKHASFAVAGVAILVVSLAVWFGGDIRSDPTERAMQELQLPSWANTEVHEEVQGSRWCVESCRVRVRTWSSTEDVRPTQGALRQELAAHEWSESSDIACGEGLHCFIRDELVAHLWVQPLNCATDEADCAESTATVMITSQAASPRVSA